MNMKIFCPRQTGCFNRRKTKKDFSLTISVNRLVSLSVYSRHATLHFALLVRLSIRPSICLSVPWLVRHIFRCVCQERISKRGSVRLSVCPSVCPLRFLKNHSFWLFSAPPMLRIKLNAIWNGSRPFYLSDRPSVCPSIYLSLSISDMSSAKVSTRRDTVRKHRCPVGLVSAVFSCAHATL